MNEVLQQHVIPSGKVPLRFWALGANPHQRGAVGLQYSIVLLCSFLGFVIPTGAAARADESASSLTDDSLRAIQFDQKLNQQVSPDLVFKDDHGGRVRLGDYFGGKPVVLVLGYYECPMLCSLVLNGLVESMQDMKLTAGVDFELIDASIDPDETPELAAAKKRTYLKRYGRHKVADGWHFLTGDEDAIRKLADEVGFRYAYDPAIQQYAHPSGFVVLTPDGKVARYFFGVTFPAKELNASLREAGAGRVGSPVQQLLLLCFHYSPLTGKYGNLIMTVVRVCAVGTLLALGVGIVIVSRRRRKQFSKRQMVEEHGGRHVEEGTGP